MTIRAAAVLLLAAGLAVAASGPVATPLAGGKFEASGATFVSGTDGVLFVDDGRPGEVLWLPLGPDGKQRGDVQAVPTGVSVADPEGITTDGTWVYIAGSLSRGKGASLARFRFDAGTRRASDAQALDRLEPMLERAVPELRGAGGKGESGLNIEGLAWDPAGNRLLLGVRSPVVDGMALAVPLRLRDPKGALTSDNVHVDGAALRIPLGGSGIRSIEQDPAAGGFQIIAGHPTGAQDFRLVTWGGAKGSVREVQAFSGEHKPEGVVRATLGGKAVTVVMFDDSRFAVLR
jgi:hypothetical protein